jgi:hypothetical protein
VTALASVRPVRRCYLGLTANPYDALSTVAWTEIGGARVSTLRWGAQHELARVEPSYVSLLLDNADAKFEALNTTGPYYPNLRPLNRLRIVDTWPPNLLTPNQASIETNTSGWSAAANCSVARSISFAADGAASLALTATAAGQMVATTPGGTSGIRVTPGAMYTGLASIRAGVGSQAASVSIWWYDAAGTFLSASSGAGVTATTGGFLQASVTALAPAAAVYAAFLVGVTAAAGGDVASLDKLSLSPGDSTTWTPGGIDYIRFTGYVVDWPRTWSGINEATVAVEAYDALGAALNAVDIPAWPWELEIRNIIEQLPATGKAVWLRLNETTGTVAADSSGYGLDGQYQGSPTLDVAGLTPDGDKGVRFVSLSRASLPYKDLVAGYPWSFTCRFRCGTDTSGARMIFCAFDGPSAPRQYMEMFIASDAYGADAGKIIALVVNPLPTGTQVVSSITVDDGVEHTFAFVAASSTSFKIYIDGLDRTSVSATNAHAYPNDLVTGYAIGNNPAATYGDFRFGFEANDVMDEALVLDGLALSATQVVRLHNTSAPYTSVSALSGFRLALLLDALGWPSADRDIDNGLTTVQQGYVAGKALAYANRLDVTEGGRLFVNGAGQIVFHDRHRILQPPYTVSQATFGEGAGEINYVGPFNHGEDDQDIYNDVRVANAGGEVQVARSKASKDRYGWKTLSLTDLLGTSDQEARDRANHDLSIYKDPVTRIRSITVKPQEDAAQGTAVWPALLGLGQSSRVTVKAQPPGLGTVITQASHIERMEETVTPTDWQVTLGLSAAEAAEFWVLGTSALDTGTRLSV